MILFYFFFRCLITFRRARYSSLIFVKFVNLNLFKMVQKKKNGDGRNIAYYNKGNDMGVEILIKPIFSLTTFERFYYITNNRNVARPTGCVREKASSSI